MSFSEGDKESLRKDTLVALEVYKAAAAVADVAYKAEIAPHEQSFQEMAERVYAKHYGGVMEAWDAYEKARAQHLDALGADG